MKRRITTYYIYLLAATGIFMLLRSSIALARGGNDDEQMTERRENLTPIGSECLYEGSMALCDSTANVLIDSAGSLDPLMSKLKEVRSGGDRVVSILHIGDSHVQAGYWTARVRALLHDDFGNAGRGLIVPYKLAGGNEPPNYAVRTTNAITTSKATDKNTPVSGLTGIGVKFHGGEAAMEIWSKNGFTTINVLHHENAPALFPPPALDIGTYCQLGDTPGSTRVNLSSRVDTVVLRGAITRGFEDMTYYGFSLENGEPGVLYHAVGLNGAAFHHFADNTTLLRGGALPLAPDLIIVSLGTNNCYGSGYRSDHARATVEGFVRRLAEAYPGSALLLTTPRESCSGSSRRGYKPNPNIADMADIIRQTAAAAGVACWDFYAAAGGKDTSEKWVAEGLSHKDRIHLTVKGYELAGDLMYDAFARHYNQWLERNYGPMRDDADAPQTWTGGHPLRESGERESLSFATESKTDTLPDPGISPSEEKPDRPATHENRRRRR